VLRIPCNNGALQLLTSYVRIAWDDATVESRELQRTAVTHIHDLIALAVGATRDAAEVARGRGLSAARLKAVKDDIAQNIDRPELSLTALAARHGLAPRLVQRLFEGEGTSFTDYVLSQRLARAYRLLSDPRRVGDKISAIAWDSGFGDLSYFNQAFRRRYGLTPSDVRARARRDVPDSRN
jgi:AraC-like DNA-binding protein